MDAIHSTAKSHSCYSCVICSKVQQKLRFGMGRKGLSKGVDQSASERDGFCKLQVRSSTFVATIAPTTRCLVFQLCF